MWNKFWRFFTKSGIYLFTGSITLVVAADTTAMPAHDILLIAAGTVLWTIGLFELKPK